MGRSRRVSYLLGVVLLSAVAVYAQRVEKEGKAWLDRKGKVHYSAELVAEDEKTLRGSYSTSIMTERSKTRPMLLKK